MVHGFYICAHYEEYKDIIVAGMGVVLWCCSAGTARRSLGQKRGGSEHCLMCAVTLTHAWPVCLPFGNWTKTGAQLVVLLHAESQSLLWRTTINLENATPIECPSSYGGWQQLTKVISIWSSAFQEERECRSWGGERNTDWTEFMSSWQT